MRSPVHKQPREYYRAASQAKVSSQWVPSVDPLIGTAAGNPDRNFPKAPLDGPCRVVYSVRSRWTNSSGDLPNRVKPVPFSRANFPGRRQRSQVLV